MALQTQQLTRVFRYSGVEWPDPGHNMTPDEVREVYSAAVPELLTAAVEGPETKDGKLIYTFKKGVGTKG